VGQLGSVLYGKASKRLWKSAPFQVLTAGLNTLLKNVYSVRFASLRACLVQQGTVVFPTGYGTTGRGAEKRFRMANRGVQGLKPNTL
jgi:hypothetical protein